MTFQYSIINNYTYCGYVMRKKAESKTDERKERFSSAKDVVLGLPVITVIGNREMYIENYRSIIYYDCECIKLKTRLGMICIQGVDLQIAYYDDEEIMIKGKIIHLEV